MFLGRLKLATQLIMLVIFTSLLTMALLGTLWFAETHAIVEREIEQRSTSLLEAAAELLTTPLAYGDLSSAGRLLDTLAREDAIDRVYIIDPAGRVLAQQVSENQQDDRTGAQAEPAGESEFALQAIRTGRRVTRTHGAHLDIAVPILLDGRPLGVISGESSFEDSRDEILAAAPRVLAAALLIGLVAALLAVTLSRSIAAPLRALAAAATAIGEGRLEATPHIRRGGEVGALGAAFTRMVADLRTARAEVAEQQRTLETRVAERTGDLERALAELQATAAERERLSDTVRDLASPVLPVLDRILVMPLIGVIDSHRAAQLTATLLGGIQEHRASVVILDVTGVPIVDTQVARVLLEAAGAARLLGAKSVLVGLRPELAQTIVGLGVDLSAIVTRADLQSGIGYALELSRS